MQTQQTRHGRDNSAAAAIADLHENDRGFDEMNSVAGRMLSQLTASSRFSGELNVDLNEIGTNLVPFPRLPFISAGLSLFRPLPTTGSGIQGSNCMLILGVICCMMPIIVI